VLKKWHLHRLSIVVSILFTIFLVCYAAKDATAFDGGVPISDIEMEETHGGFQMPNGNFVFFSMDFMHMDYLAHNDPAGPSSSGILPGILGDQGELLNNTNFETLSVPGVAGVINNNVTNNIGFTNVGVILGNNNVQQLFNFLNLNLAFFQVTNPDNIKPVLSNWMHLTF
jgi:hypothetical protein